MLSVWSQWLLASQALLENAWEQDGLTGFGDHHDHDTRDDHDGRDKERHKKTSFFLEKLRKGGGGSRSFGVLPKKQFFYAAPNLARMPLRSLKRVKNELIHSQSDVVSLLLLLLWIIVLFMIIQQE